LHTNLDIEVINQW